MQKGELGKETDGHKGFVTIGQLFVDELTAAQSEPAKKEELKAGFFCSVFASLCLLHLSKCWRLSPS